MRAAATLAALLFGVLAVALAVAVAASASSTATNAVAWGANVSGQLGDGSTAGSDTPVEVAGLPGAVIAMAGGEEDSLALLRDGKVVAWGENVDGQLGDRSDSSSANAVEVEGLPEAATAIAAGYHHSLALLSDGKVMAWGDNETGQLGDGGTADSDAPVEVTGLPEAATAITAGAETSFALLKSGKVMAWGANGSSQLGDGNASGSAVPVEVTGLPEAVTAISAGGYNALALLQDGVVMAWGSNEDGQLGNGSFGGSSDTAVQVTGLPEATAAIAAGGYHGLALLQDGKVMAWGFNVFGQLGDGTTIDSDAPVEVTGLPEAVTAIAGGGFHSLALLKDGKVMSWGGNGEGELGDGSSGGSSDSPVEVMGLAGVAGLAAGYSHSLAFTVPPLAPSAETQPPELVTPSSALLYGIANAHGVDTTCVFEYGTSLLYGETIPCVGQSGPVEDNVGFTALATGLEGDTEYDYRVITTNGLGTTVGNNVSFTTPPSLRPMVMAVGPGSGPGAGGTTVTITGINFSEASAVMFGATPAARFRVTSPTTITAKSPPGSGTVDVTVANAEGSSVPAPLDTFTYAPAAKPPVIARISPRKGTGGTRVVIEGSGFEGEVVVRFGDADATDVTTLGTSLISVVAPAGTGTVPVSVHTFGGTSATAKKDTFRYLR